MKRICLFGMLTVMLMLGCVYGTEQDRKIEAAAKESYVFRTYLMDDDIHIDSQEGVVTLTGTVNEGFHQALATDTVANLPGVKSVDNRLTITGALLKVGSDAYIRRDVKNMFMFHRSMNGADTGVEVEEGQVTLSGEAKNQFQKYLTSEYVKDVQGVTGVDNEMSVAKIYSKDFWSVWHVIDDASITSQIKTTLALHSGTGGYDADISVKNGVVTLTGQAGTFAQKNLITRCIEDVHGVRKIKNRMVID